MADTGILGLILIGICILASYHAFKNSVFFDQNSFNTDNILSGKEYRRLLTSGFIHITWLHLIFNMLALHSFSGALEPETGSLRFAVIYLSSLIGGNLLSLYIHRNHYDYSAAGASGAISGIVFASIVLFPEMQIRILYLYSVPTWAYSLLFTLVSIYGIKSQAGSIGHEAHLGGGITGIICTAFLYPEMVLQNYIPVAIILIPSLFFIWIIIYKPSILLIDNPFSQQGVHSFESKYHQKKRNREEELDRILDKIHNKGMNSLTKKEKEMLEEFSTNNNYS
jgi:membrane associated rhomboid family serine protease